jgi:hypothetical protein
MSGFDKSSSTDLPASQHRDSTATEPAPVKWGEPMPLLWGEIYQMRRRVSELHGSYVTQWLKQTFQSWKSVFRRTPRLIPERGN